MKGMTFREWTGLGLIVVGLLLLPAAWAFSRILWLLSFSMFAVGVWIFYTCRVLRHEAQLDKTRSGQHTGREIPTDIHNYTGWQQAGRSKTMDTSSESIDADGD
jgi:uncharacterized protein (DUF58 family)